MENPVWKKIISFPFGNIDVVLITLLMINFALWFRNELVFYRIFSQKLGCHNFYNFFPQYSTDKDGSVMGVTVTRNSMLVHCRAITQACNYTEGENMVCVLDFKRETGLWHSVLASVLNGMHVIFIPYALMKVNPASWMQMITKHKGTLRINLLFGIPFELQTRKLTKLIFGFYWRSYRGHSQITWSTLGPVGDQGS